MYSWKTMLIFTHIILKFNIKKALSIKLRGGFTVSFTFNNNVQNAKKIMEKLHNKK